MGGYSKDSTGVDDNKRIKQLKINDTIYDYHARRTVLSKQVGRKTRFNNSIEIEYVPMET